MSTWDLNHIEAPGEDAFVQFWDDDAAHVHGWDVEAWAPENLWNEDTPAHHFDPLHAPAHPPPNPYNPHNPRPVDTIFPPPRDFIGRPDNFDFHHTAPSEAAQRQPDITRSQTTAARPPPSPRERLSDQQQGRFGYIVDHLFDRPTPATDTSTPTASNDSAEFVTLEESSSGSEADMPPTTRRRGSYRRSSVVDLTSGSSSQGVEGHSARRGVKRAAEGSTSRATKRRATEPEPAEDIEEIDLAGEAPSAEEELRQQQQRETIQAQQAAQGDQRPQRIGQRQCIICMENYTNATVTSCGHFFCHECLTQALIAGENNSERNVGSCPVCRKALSRKKKNEIIPIAFMKNSQFAINQAAIQG